MYNFFAILFLILFEFIFSSYSIDVTVIAFGIGKNMSLVKPIDPSPFNLDIVQYLFDKFSYAGQDSTVNFVGIEDNCTFDFEWQEKALAVIEKKLSSTHSEYFMHIGPLCEYPAVQAANSEITGYVGDVVKISTIGRRVVFFTSTLGFQVPQNGLSSLSHYVNVDHKLFSSNEPLFVTLNSDFEYYAELIYNFTMNILSPYTAFLCPVKEYLGNMDTFCRRITEIVMRLSDKNHQNLVSFRYFGTKDHFDWKDVWNHILQRSRYVVFCGDDQYFAQWLEIGQHLWDEHKVEDFVIFFLTVNFESSGYSELLFKRDTLLNETLRNVKSLGNIKILNIRSPIECANADNICSSLWKDFQKLTTLPKNGSQFNEWIFVNKFYFYSLSVFKLFEAFFQNIAEFWTYTDTSRHFESKYKAHKELQVYELRRENGIIRTQKSCSMKNRITYKTICDLHYIDDRAPPRAPGECGYVDCIIATHVPWITIVIALSCVIGGGLLIASTGVFFYLRWRRNTEWSVAKLGDVRIKIDEIEAVQFKHDDKSNPSKKSKSLSSSQNICLAVGRDVLGTYLGVPVVIHPFRVAKSRAHSVDDAVTKLRAFALENVSQIHGYVVQTNPYMYGLVMEYGDHGVLKTLMQLDELDLALKLPLMADLCRALEHIHKSSLKHHGNLTSICCIIDAHFVLKVQLTEFPTFKKLNSDVVVGKSDDHGDHESASANVWSAPEILRKQTNVNLQLADIYSFGIIAHEIIYQRGPFYVSPRDIAALHMPNVDGHMPKTPNEIAHLIVNIIKDSKRRQIRPTIVTRAGEETVMLILKDMIKSCWEDNPTQRCDVKRINDTIRKVMKDMNIVNVFSSMVKRLEYYSKHLQEAVQQKADKIERERRRVRRVLEQLFPGVAKELINGEKPKPVQYKNICVYFNDLVGFTNICSVNDSSIVAKFLNTLFVKYDSIIDLYNIHPVTRIGDAYMLVSGIPLESTGKSHASEIAQAALQLVEVVRTTVFDDVSEHKSMKIRTGIASGKAASGVVGSEIPSFGICGDAVVVASTMESHSEAMKILVAESSYNLLDKEFDFDPTPKHVTINNVIVLSYWLKGMKNVTKIVLNSRLDGTVKPEIGK